MRNSLIAVAILLMLSLVPGAAVARVHVWVFDSSEDQIKNGPLPDGSTDSPATGRNKMIYDDDAATLTYTFSWADLQGDLTKLHVHGPADASTSNPAHLLEIFNTTTEIEAAGVGKITGSTSGVIPVTDTTTDCDSGGMIACFLEERAYVNVHTQAYPMGEIRGNLVQVADTPTLDPLWPMLALGLAGGIVLARRAAHS